MSDYETHRSQYWEMLERITKAYRLSDEERAPFTRELEALIAECEAQRSAAVGESVTWCQDHCGGSIRDIARRRADADEG